MKLKHLLLLYLLISIVGIWFLARLWLPQGYVLAGHDSGLALNIASFFKSRVYAWWPQGFGQDNSPHFGSLIIHGIDYLISVIQGVSYAGNSLLIFFWFSVLFISAFLFAYKLKDRLGRFSPLLFPVFIVVNFYILQSVFILERAKYSIFIASVLFLLIAIKIAEGKIKPLLGAILTSLVLFLFNSGSWLGVPLYGGFIIIAISFALSEFLWGIKEKNLLIFKRIIVFFVLTTIGFLILNSYSILPYFATLKNQDYTSLVSSSVINQNKEWLRALSQASSFLNFFRLQGVPDWYSGSYEINPAHSFANLYLSNKYLIVASFLFPLISFSSFLLAKTRKQKKLISIFGLSVLLSMFFMAGSHGPFGSFYELIFDYFPGFAIFRSPYFKFGSAFYIGTSGMMAFAISNLIERFESRYKIKNIFVGFVISFLVMAAWLFYHRIIFSPEKIFGWQTGYSTKIKTPQYIEDFRGWAVKANLGDGRILLVPPLNTNWENDAYSWGYWSLTTLPENLGIPNILSNDPRLSNEEREWVNRLYGMIVDKNEQGAINLSSRLGVKYLLLRKDVLADASWSSAQTPDDFESALSSFEGIVPIKSFGQWVLYETKVNSDKFSVEDSLVLITDKQEYLARELVENKHSFIGNQINDLGSFFSQELSVVGCESCLLEEKTSINNLPEVRILPSSPLYFFKTRREESVLSVATTNQNKIDAYLGFVLTRAAEVKTMLDFGVDEKYIIADLETMVTYLENLNKLVKDSSGGQLNYFLAKRILDFLNPVEISFKNYVLTGGYNQKSEKLRQEILALLWQIFSYHKSFEALLITPEVLEKNKTYYPIFEETGEYNLFVKVGSLSRTESGGYLSPSSIILNKIDKEESLAYEGEENGWLKYKFTITEKGKADLKLIFDSNRDLLVNLRTSLEPLPTDERACFVGNIDYFNPLSKYLVTVSTPEKNQYLKLYISEGVDISLGKNDFLHGEEEVEIYPILPYQPFRHLYYPSSYTKEPQIYLCSGNKELPKINKIEVHEIISPLVVVSKERETNQFKLPELKFEKINQTKYVVSVKDANGPFVLLFNERYNQSWKITPEPEKKEHFMVDGYANAWIIDKEDGTDFVIEYVPQRLFLYGAIVSAVSLVGIGVYCFLTLRKRAKNEKN